MNTLQNYEVLGIYYEWANTCTYNGRILNLLKCDFIILYNFLLGNTHDVCMSLTPSVIKCLNEKKVTYVLPLS